MDAKVKELLALKTQYKEKTGADYKPPQAASTSEGSGEAKAAAKQVGWENQHSTQRSVYGCQWAPSFAAA